MRILYITRTQKQPRSTPEYFQNFFIGRSFAGQDGFFEASLWSAFPDTTAVTFNEARSMAASIDQHFDWLVMNYKCNQAGTGIDFETVDCLEWIKSLRACGKVLAIHNAKATKLPSEDFLDLFDIVFKRELLKDLDQYSITQSTKKKLHTTMLSCPLINTYYSKWQRQVISKEPLPIRSKPLLKNDVSFVGADSNPLRRKVLTELASMPINFYGGLYQRKTRHPVNWSGPKHSRQTKREYMQTTAQSRINLVLNGIGEFTFRHLETWYLEAFMLTHSSLLDVQLPGGNPEENVHFTCFENLEELKDKVNYYLENDSEREVIASAGRKFFEKIYDYSAHGRYIKKVLHSS